MNHGVEISCRLENRERGKGKTETICLPLYESKQQQGFRFFENALDKKEDLLGKKMPPHIPALLMTK